MKKLAAFYRKGLDIKVVGITGSVGKTSTKEMIASVLSQKYEVLKTAGNFNNEIGLPLTIFQIKKKHQVAVLEMGISDFGDRTLPSGKSWNKRRNSAGEDGSVRTYAAGWNRYFKRRR